MYKLDQFNKKLLYLLDKDCRISENILGKKINRSREAVNQRIKKLMRDDILEGFILSVDFSKLGKQGFKIYLQFKNDNKKLKEFKSYLEEQKGLFWYGVSDGLWNIHATFYLNSVNEFNEIKNNLVLKFGDYILNRRFGVLVEVIQYEKNFLINEITNDRSGIIYGNPEIEKILIDEVDKKILSNLVFNAKKSFVQLGREIKVNVDTINYRFRKMIKSNLIFQKRIAINHHKLGYSLFKAFISLENLTKEKELQWRRRLSKETNIINVVRQLSDWDYELEIMASSYHEFNLIMDKLKEEFKGILSAYEFILMKEEHFIFKKNPELFFS